jgi:hypothetical protein
MFPKTNNCMAKATLSVGLVRRKMAYHYHADVNKTTATLNEAHLAEPQLIWYRYCINL